MEIYAFSGSALSGNQQKAKYQALVAAGKPAKVAIVTVMRKLIVLANSLLKANHAWTEKTA